MDDRIRCAWAEGHALLRVYHDTEYGFPIEQDDEFLERLVLEINQAGLSWLTVLKKREAFQQAFERFDIDRVADYTDKDRERLLEDAGIIRNRLKINATIHNAQVFQTIREEKGSFKIWLEGHSCSTLDEWVKLFRKTFKFTGPEIVNEFLMSTGYLPIDHDQDCFLNV
jgi:DNA-3-methyladenine glycosylase I